jgi:hypothetical protein
MLEALPAEAHATDALPSRVRMHLSPAYGRLLRLALVGLLLFAAARFGWNAGGIGLALAGVGVVGLFTVPLIVGE